MEICVADDKNILFNKFRKYDEGSLLTEYSVTFKTDLHHAWHKNGFTLYKSGQYLESIDCYDRALKIKPDSYIPGMIRLSLFPSR